MVTLQLELDNDEILLVVLTELFTQSQYSFGITQTAHWNEIEAVTKQARNCFCGITGGSRQFVSRKTANYHEWKWKKKKVFSRKIRGLF